MLDFFDYQMPDNQAQDLKYQINQYLSEILTVTLGSFLGPPLMVSLGKPRIRAVKRLPRTF